MHSGSSDHRSVCQAEPTATPEQSAAFPVAIPEQSDAGPEAVQELPTLPGTATEAVNEQPTLPVMATEAVTEQPALLDTATQAVIEQLVLPDMITETITEQPVLPDMALLSVWATHKSFLATSAPALKSLESATTTETVLQSVPVTETCLLRAHYISRVSLGVVIFVGFLILIPVLSESDWPVLSKPTALVTPLKFAALLALLKFPVLPVPFKLLALLAPVICWHHQDCGQDCRAGAAGAHLVCPSSPTLVFCWDS